MDRKREVKGGRAADSRIRNADISPERFAQYAEEFEVTIPVVAGFFRILEQKGIPLEEQDRRLRETAKWHQDLLAHFLTVSVGSEPEIYALKKQVAQALKDGDYAKAEKLLNRIEKLDRNALGKLRESIAEQQAGRHRL